MKQFFLFIGLVLIFLASCRKEELVGPELQDIFGEFAILETLSSDRETVDFAAGETVTFSAQLTVRTDWTISIIGLTSGARKEITGRDRDIQGEIANWDGTITFAPLFGAEECMTMMTFANHPDTLLGDTITVTSVKPEDSVDLLLSDFETGDGWGTFAEAAAQNIHVTGPYFVQDPQSETPAFIEVEAGEGVGHWRMTYANQGSVFICGINTTASASQGTPEGSTFDFENNNPDHVYINLLVHGFGDGNTRLSIGLQEDDNLDGTYDRFTEGTYNTEILVDWVGWKVVSVPLSAFNLSTVGGFGNIDGTGQQDIDRILSIEFLLLAVEGTSTQIGYGLDYINFTRFEPWNP